MKRRELEKLLTSFDVMPRDAHTPLTGTVVALILAAALPLMIAALVAHLIQSWPRQPCGGHLWAAVLTDCELER